MTEFAVLDPDHRDALEAIAPVVARLQRVAGGDTPLVLGGPVIDAIRTRTSVSPTARLFVLVGEHLAAMRVREAARRESIGNRPPIVLDCTEYPEGARQTSILGNRLAYCSPIQVHLVGYDQFNRQTIMVPDVYLVDDVPAIAMALSRVDDACHHLDGLHESGRDLAGAERLEREINASLHHALHLLGALDEDAIEDGLAAVPIEEQAMVADLMHDYIADVANLAAGNFPHDPTLAARARAGVEQVSARVLELGPARPGLGFRLRQLINRPNPSDQFTQLRLDLAACALPAASGRTPATPGRPVPSSPGPSPQVTSHPARASGKGLAPVISLDDLRSARAARINEGGFTR